MSWNYRIIKYKDHDTYGLHEVHYKDDKPISMTIHPARFRGETPAELISAMELALKDAKERPVFEEPENWEDLQ